MGTGQGFSDECSFWLIPLPICALFVHVRCREGTRERGVPTYVEVCGSNSVVECDLAKVDVAGSNPVSRSTK